MSNSEAKVKYLRRYTFGLMFYATITAFLYWALVSGGIDSMIIKCLLFFFVGIPWIKVLFQLPSEFKVFVTIMKSSEAALATQYFDHLRVHGKHPDLYGEAQTE